MEVERIQRIMRQKGIDVLLSTSNDSVFYLTKAYKIPARSIPTRITIIVIPAAGEPVMVACAITRALVETSSKIKKAVFYREYIDSPIEMAADIVKRSGWECGRIGLEMVALNAFFYRQLVQALPQAEFVAADDVIDSVRMVKTEEEIDRLAKAAQATDRAIRKAFLTAKPGVMELAVERAIGIELLNNGADMVEHITCGAGMNSALAHPNAEERPLEDGELIRTDTGGIFGGYMSDLARTVIVGKPTAEQNEYWEALYQIHGKLIAAAKPGITGQELHQMCLDMFARQGLVYAYTITGHGLGLGQHDAPIIGPDTATPLEEGMVINLEPAHRNLGAIMHIEDTLLITKEGGKVLSRSADWSKLSIA